MQSTICNHAVWLSRRGWPGVGRSSTTTRHRLCCVALRQDDREKVDIDVHVGHTSISFADLGLIVDAEGSSTSFAFLENCAQCWLKQFGSQLRSLRSCQGLTTATAPCGEFPQLNSIGYKNFKTLQQESSLGQNPLITSPLYFSHITGFQWSSAMTISSSPLLSSCVQRTAPEYLREVIPMYAPVCSLRSSSQSRLCLPSTDETNKRSLGARAFKNAAPKLWNSLPDVVRNAETVSIFSLEAENISSRDLTDHQSTCVHLFVCFAFFSCVRWTSVPFLPS